MDGAYLTAPVDPLTCQPGSSAAAQTPGPSPWHEVRINRVSATMQQWRTALARGRADSGAVRYPAVTSALDRERAAKAVRR